MSLGVITVEKRILLSLQSVNAVCNLEHPVDSRVTSNLRLSRQMSAFSAPF